MKGSEVRAQSSGQASTSIKRAIHQAGSRESLAQENTEHTLDDGFGGEVSGEYQQESSREIPREPRSQGFD
jgi:hypothetical protein